MSSNGTGGAVVITGASTGIGQACALRLDRLGMRVFAGVRREIDAERLRGAASARLTPLMIDVTDTESIRSAAAIVEAETAGTGLAGLVNNAGIAIAGPLEYMPIDQLRRQLDVNLVGHVAVTQAFLPMLRRARGRIVNIGSIGGRMATPLMGPYNASKFAMEAITDSLRGELRPWRMSVSIVEPGAIATPLWERGTAIADEMERDLPPEGRQRYGRAIAAVRQAAEKMASAAIPPDEVAKAVAHALLSRHPKTRYVVGRDARVQAVLAKVVPDRLQDRLKERIMGLPTEAPEAEPAEMSEVR